MLQGLWQAEQMHNFMVKEITSLYELPPLSPPPLLVAFVFLESEPTTQKMQFISSLFRRCFCWQSQRSSLLFQALVVECF